MSATRLIDRESMPAALAAVPGAIRAAIIAAVDSAYDEEQDDYLANCSNEPGDNIRAGHPFEALSLLRSWLEGNADRLHVDTAVRIADPGRPGFLKLTRCKTVGEVLGEILAIAGRPDGGFTVIDGAGEYFSAYPGVGGREWPEGRIVVFAVTGGSEGHYVHVEVHTGDGRSELLILGKGLDGADAAWTLARRLAGILGA